MTDIHADDYDADREPDADLLEESAGEGYGESEEERDEALDDDE